MIDDTDRKRIIDAIALLEQVLRSTDNSLQSAAMLRAIETARQSPPGGRDTSTTGVAGGGGGGGGGGGDFGREAISWHKQL